MPKTKKPAKAPQRRVETEVAVAHRPGPLDQVIAKVRAAALAALDFADATAEKLIKTLRP